MLLGWNGPVAETRELDYIERQAVARGFPPAPRWKEIVRKLCIKQGISSVRKLPWVVGLSSDLVLAKEKKRKAFGRLRRESS
jgi:hypothetical protein